MNKNTYNKMPNSIKKNRLKTNLLILPLVNILFQEFRKYDDIKIEIFSMYHENNSPNTLGLQISYRNIIFSIVSTESIRYTEPIYNIFKINKNKNNYEEMGYFTIDEIPNIIDMILENYKKNITNKPNSSNKNKSPNTSTSQKANKSNKSNKNL